MKVARQFIAWNRCQNGNRPVGYGMMGSDRRATIRTITQSGVRIRPCPTGRILNLDVFQAINCLATITWSLRDRNPSSPDLPDCYDSKTSSSAPSSRSGLAANGKGTLSRRILRRVTSTI
jgi:hypothetical protein